MKTLKWIFDGDGKLSSEELTTLEVLSAGPITKEIEEDLKNKEIRITIDKEIAKYLRYDEAPMESKKYVYGLYCSVLAKTGLKTLTMEDFIVQTADLLADTLDDIESDKDFPSDISLSEWVNSWLYIR